MNHRSLTQLAFTLAAALMLGGVAAQGQDQAARIIDGEPFDRMILKEKKQILKLRPIDQLKKRRPLGERDPDFRLHVRLYEKPTQQYEVAWVDIESVELFEELVLAEAAELVAAKKFDAAYEYFQYLERRDKEFPGIASAYQKCLFQEATYWLDQKKPDQALVLLGEVHSRNPKFEKLEETYLMVVDQLIGQHAQAGNYQSARRMLRGLAEKYPGSAVTTKWQEEFIKQATQAMELAKKHNTDGKLLEAYQQAAVAVSRWPLLEGSKELLLEVHGKYPLLVVGVLERGPAADAPPSLLPTWAGRRQQRLVDRRLVEPVAFIEGRLKYASPLGTLTPQPTGLRIELTDGLVWSMGAKGDGPQAARPLSSYDIAGTLASLADPQSPAFSPAWADLANKAATPTALQAEIEFLHASPRAEALLQTSLVPWDYSPGSSTGRPTLGPFRLEARGESQSRFVVQPEALARLAKLPREVAERSFLDGRMGLRALTAGEIVALDRVDVGDLPLAAKQKSLVVERYAAPTVHFLLPNLKRPLARQRAFRRAIAYGLDRPQILTTLVGDKPDLGQILTGPFPIGFGYDDKLADLPCDPKMSVALANVAFEAAGMKRSSAKSDDPAPRIVLAHPPTTTARKACVAIRRQLGFSGKHANGLGMEIALKETPEGTIPDDCDLLYVEWPAMEPLTDARRLFAADGLAGGCGDWLDLAVRRAEAAGTAAALERELQDLHRLVQDEAAVIPLWQMAEHCVYRKTLTGLAPRPVVLYQDVEKWQCPPWIPAD